MSFFSRTFRKLRETKYRYLCSSSHVRIVNSSRFRVEKNAKIRKSRIQVDSGEVTIGENCVLSNVYLIVRKGHVYIEPNCIVQGCVIEVSNGSVYISHHSKIACRHLWVRFGGELSIGSYTNLNQGSEVRADERVQIGSYCQISYNVNIWDTNTHNILPTGERKRLAEQHFPKFGHEESKPLTKPVIIGDFCWIGEYATILKGTTLDDNVVVGYHTLLTGQHIESGNKVVQNTDIKII